ncbi:hypothetical protein ACWOAH_10130 [Vagococcus vulneris]|uniref:Uncharacterized protein n=1 Tax=Vagococcus vulneris TaxID=1977869 RepID=A0A429ZUB1_9ENTE|nr:hypothetical protein [Vagococcus vulneris]RST97317.1 hypothetical protein CBF37_10015 [Vagococcus vulneris]
MIEKKDDGLNYVELKYNEFITKNEELEQQLTALINDYEKIIQHNSDIFKNFPPRNETKRKIKIRRKRKKNTTQDNKSKPFK